MQAEKLAVEVPRLSDTAHLRILAVGRAMEQLAIRHNAAPSSTINASAGPNEVRILPLPAQFRKWLQSIDSELETTKEQISHVRFDMSALQRLKASQQV